MIKSLLFRVHLAQINPETAEANTLHSVALGWYHPVVELVIEGMLLSLRVEHRHASSPQEAQHSAECITVSVDENTAIVLGQWVPA